MYSIRIWPTCWFWVCSIRFGRVRECHQYFAAWSRRRAGHARRPMMCCCLLLMRRRDGRFGRWCHGQDDDEWLRGSCSCCRCRGCSRRSCIQRRPHLPQCIIHFQRFINSLFGYNLITWKVVDNSTYSNRKYFTSIKVIKSTKERGSKGR